MTNADKIRNMTNDELEYFLNTAVMCGGLIRSESTSSNCRGCKLPFCQNIGNWLNEEVIETKIFQFSYESSEAENGVASITYELSGTEEALNNAEILWLTTIDLSNTKYHNEDTKQFLVGDGWSDEDIEFIFAHFPNGVSSDPITAYDQCLKKIKELGLIIKELEESDKADVWTSYGVY